MALARPQPPPVCRQAQPGAGIGVGLPAPAGTGARYARNRGVLGRSTRGAWAVRETAHPPTFYLPLADVQRALLSPAAGGSFCEWKGPARYWDLVDGARCLPQVAWTYPQPLAGAEPLADCVAFYAHELDCTVGGQKVVAQAGGFYGGWITPDLAGPFKGAPGSGAW